MIAMHIDLNCDLGEGCGHDAELMELITSANVGCGFHAGDTETTFAALRLAAKRGVQVGAHPGFPDRANFGRVDLPWNADRVYQECLYQTGALLGLAGAAGCPVCYLKPHGALYNMACRDMELARALVESAKQLGLALMGLPGSCMQRAAQGKVHFIAEGFADRRYLPDGSLTPRSQPDAFVLDPAQAVAQAEKLIRDQGVVTLCVHGDNPQALAFVQALRAGFVRQGYSLAPFAADGAA
jgi:5-oxoprolinase (ATP-hydrolysing) subunit A